MPEALQARPRARSNLRSKLARASVGLLAFTGLGILLVVVVIEFVVAQRGIDTLEQQIRGTLNARGESLVSSQADVFRAFVEDNALTEVSNTLALTVAGQDVIYGLYTDHDGRPWAYCSPTSPCSTHVRDNSFSAPSTERIARDLTLPLPLQASDAPTRREVFLFNDDVLEFNQPVRIEGQLVGNLRYGLSTRDLKEALTVARDDRSAILRTALTSVTAMILGALLIGIWYARRTAHRITSPLLALTNAAQELAQGRRTGKVEIESGDELEDLGRTFNAMVSELQKSYSELEAKNAQLEREIEERVQAQQERTELQNHLIQSQKMEAFGQLAGGVAHDFNNILAIVVGNSELVEVLLDGAEQRDVRRLVGEISDAADRGAELTRQLLTFARREADNPRVMDLNDILRRFEALIRRILEETIDLRIERGHELRKIFADPGRIEQVMMNLCVNARDAMNGSGTLILRTRDESLETPLTTTTGRAAPGRYSVLEAQDTGAGMSPEVLERVFEPFFTTKPAGQGTGLGLATVHGIVRAAGGLLNISSSPGQGTTFSIYFPVHQGRELMAQAREEPLPPQGNGERVLICEDNEAVRLMTGRILEKGGYKVTSTATAAEAVELLGDVDFALLVTDVVMPEMDGGELVETAKLLKEELPVLFVSGYTAGVLDSYGINSESPSFLRKPFRAAALLERVHALIVRVN